MPHDPAGQTAQTGQEATPGLTANPGRSNDLMTSARRFVLVFAAVFVAAFAAIATYLYVQHSEFSRAMRQNVVFESTQLRAEYLTFRNRAAEVLAGMPDRERAEVQVSYDILVARVGMLREGRSAVLYEQDRELAPQFRGLAAEILRWEPHVARFVAGDDHAGYTLLRELSAASVDFGAFTARANSLTQQRMVDTDHRIRMLYLLLLGLLLGGAVVVAVISRLLLRQAAATDAAHRHLTALARDLEAARRQAEAASRAKSSFLASMSHELRTPLNAVIGFADIMRQGLFGPIGNARYDEYVASIQQSGQHLLSLINDILDMSRIEAGRMELNEDRIDITDLIADCIDLVAMQARNKGVRLVPEAGSSEAALWADERALRQMLLNLMANGVKFTAEGGSVTVSHGQAEDGWYEIVVRDTGIGMAESEVVRVFEPFARGGSQLVRQQYDGTGLGLPITRRLVELHGGRIQLVSQLGQGTTARLRFPPERISRVSDFGAMLGVAPQD